MLQGGTDLFNKSVYNIKNMRKSLYAHVSNQD